MNVKYFLLFFLAFSLLIETTFFSFPLVVICSLFLFILFSSLDVFISIFVVGLLLDGLKAETIGVTPLFLFCIFLLFTLYQRVFNFKDIGTLIIFIFAAALIYAHLFSYGVNLFTYVLFFAVLLLSVRYLKNSFVPQ